MSCRRVYLSLKASTADQNPGQIAIGGTIGTGLFVGSGGALAAGGPVGVWVRHGGVAFLYNQHSCATMSARLHLHVNHGLRYDGCSRWSVAMVYIHRFFDT